MPRPKRFLELTSVVQSEASSCHRRLRVSLGSGRHLESGPDVSHLLVSLTSALNSLKPRDGTNLPSESGCRVRARAGPFPGAVSDSCFTVFMGMRWCPRSRRTKSRCADRRQSLRISLPLRRSAFLPRLSIDLPASVRRPSVDQSVWVSVCSSGPCVRPCVRRPASQSQAASRSDLSRPGQQTGKGESPSQAFA